MSVSVAKNTFYLTAATIGQKILAFLYFLFVTRVFLKEGTGAYFLALAITTIFSVVADFGITSVIIREVAKAPEKALILVRRALGLKLPIVILSVVGAIVTARLLNYDSEIRLLILLACAVMVEDAISLLYFGVLRGLHILKYESFGMIIGELITVAVGGLSLVFCPYLFFLVLALVVGSFFNAIFSASLVVKKLGWRAIVTSPEDSGQLLKVSLPFALAGGFSKLYSYIDSILLSFFISTGAVGLYAVAYKMTYAFQFLPLAFVAALYPGMSSLVGKDQKRLAEIFEKSFWYLLLIGSPIIFGIFAVAPDIVNLTRKEYLEAVPVLRILIFVLLPLFLDFPIGSLLNAAGRQTTKMVIMGLTAAINAVANLIFIPRWGIGGAAVAAEISFWFMFLAGLYFVPKIVPEIFWKKVIWLAAKIIFSGGLMAVITMLLRPYLGFIPVVLVGGVVYTILIFATRSLNVNQVKESLHLIAKKKSVEVYAKNSPSNS